MRPGKIRIIKTDGHEYIVKVKILNIDINDIFSVKYTYYGKKYKDFIFSTRLKCLIMDTYIVELIWKGLKHDENLIGRFNIRNDDIDRLEDEYGDDISINIYDDTTESADTYQEIYKKIIETPYGQIWHKFYFSEKLNETVFIERLHDGSIFLNTIIDNEMYKKTYMYYTLKEAKSLFDNYVLDEKNKPFGCRSGIIYEGLR